MGDVIAQAPADAVAGTRRGKIRHGAGVKGIFAVDEFGMQNAIALVQGRVLRSGSRSHCDKVFGAGDAAAGDGGGKVPRLGVIMPLGAEQPVNPSVLVAHQAHIVKVCFLVLQLRHADGIIPKTKSIHAVPAFRDGEKRLAVPAFNPGHQNNMPPFHSIAPDVEGAIDPEPGQQMRIVRVVEIITPEQRSMFGGEDGKFIAVEYSVSAFLRAVAAFDQLFMLPLELFQFALEGDFVHWA